MSAKIPEMGQTPWLIDNMSTAVILVSEDGRIRAINPAGETLFSLSARQALGQTIHDLFPHSTLPSTLQRALSTGESLTEWDLEIKVSGQDPVTVDCLITPVAGRQRKPAALLEMINMEHHRRMVREETFLAQHQTVRALVRGIAHEVKNPLGGIRGAAQLLERELTKESHKEYTQIIINEVDRLRNLVDRMVGPNGKTHKTLINIHEVAEHVRGLVEIETPETLVIRRDYDPSLPELLADRDQIIQALLNIVRNAVQAVGGMGEIILRSRSQRQVTIGQKRHRLVVRLDVIDQGPGVPPEIKEDIFYPMITGRAEGTGLGLSIAQSLVHVQGGMIEFSSRPGETIFSICLPVEGAE
jgi:two-component system nitrogen regulation sensor histidine kinase GlnL